MPGDAPELRALVRTVGEFYLTDRAMRRAQERIESLLESGEADAASVATYLTEVARYFQGFEREARAHLKSVDRRLTRVNQVHFNLTAERGVAVRRIEITQRVLDDVNRLSRNP
ncbi:MAG: hypothetical protein JOZ38_00690 [Candidatus Eremiobacteraeota bacterium]|nr:hypothetical protein [Candidatus Eremiobacteraeota bacterium]